jgi:hypothetical protein
MKNLTLIAAAALIAGTSALPVLAEQPVAQDKADKLGAELKAQGYEVRRMEMEDGYIEVYALKDGKRMELYFDSNLKQVTRKGDNG